VRLEPDGALAIVVGPRSKATEASSVTAIASEAVAVMAMWAMGMRVNLAGTSGM
jgi:hypothetical protein